MTVIRTTERPLSPDNRPAWCRVSGAGTFRMPCAGARFDRHFHDCDEYWLVFSGRAKILSGEFEAYVQPGDIVCTPAGEEHDILEVYDDLELFWFEDVLPEGARAGRLYRDELAERGHLVPCLPLPPEFPYIRSPSPGA